MSSYETLLRCLFPVLPPDEETQKAVQGAKRFYRRWEVAAVLPVFAFAAVLTYGWYQSLLHVARRAHPFNGPAVFAVLPIDPVWLLPALVLGMISSAAPMHVLYRLLLGRRRYRQYMIYCNLEHGYDGWRAFRCLAVTCVVAVGGFIVLALNTYTEFRDDRIVINRFWSFSEDRYPYAAIRGVYSVEGFTAPIG